MQGSKRNDCSMENDQMTAPRRPDPNRDDALAPVPPGSSWALSGHPVVLGDLSDHWPDPADGRLSRRLGLPHRRLRGLSRVRKARRCAGLRCGRHRSWRRAQIHEGSPVAGSWLSENSEFARLVGGARWIRNLGSGREGLRFERSLEASFFGAQLLGRARTTIRP